MNQTYISFLCSTYLIHLLEDTLGDTIKLLTPRDPKQRGCQLSLFCAVPVKPVFEKLEGMGVVCDIRVCCNASRAKELCLFVVLLYMYAMH